MPPFYFSFLLCVDRKTCQVISPSLFLQSSDMHFKYKGTSINYVNFKGVKGVEEVCHCVTRGGAGILDFVTSHFCCFNLIVSRCKIEKYLTSQKCDHLWQGRGRGPNLWRNFWMAPNLTLKFISRVRKFRHCKSSKKAVKRYCKSLK